MWGGSTLENGGFHGGPGLNNLSPGGELVLWQHKPAPFQTACEPLRASSSHQSGMVVGMGDASAHMVSPKISALLFWYACTPANDDPVKTNDW